jgi:uridine phosphorylase
MNKREFITQTGTYNNKRITVMSSGMGTDNVEILLTELDALANIDLKKRVQREKHRRLRILRVGTSGSLQAGIPVDSYVASATAVGLDTLMCYYELPQDETEKKRAAAIQANLNLPYTPYCASGSAEMLRQFGHDMIEGNTITCPGFYAPQGRRLRLPLRIPNLIKEMNYFHEGDYWLTNFEMETAGYYAAIPTGRTVRRVWWVTGRLWSRGRNCNRQICRVRLCVSTSTFRHLNDSRPMAH